MNQNTINEKASKFLGKHLSQYETSYNPDLLVTIERKFNREDYKITNDDFVGFDIWHNYECSFLTDNGLPIALVGKLKIPCNSEFFIESKSLKLYFFSFQMEKLGANTQEAIKKYKEIVIRDISNRVKAPVEFEVFDKLSGADIFTDFKNVKDLIDVDNIKFNVFKETPDLIEFDKKGELKIYFTNVRSNCRVTHQPDFANLFIHIKGNLPKIESLLKYIVSFRNEYHFHEEVTEQIYKILKNKLNPEKLMVTNLFTRRGGLDICPCRANSEELIDKNFGNTYILHNPTIFQ